MCIKFNVLKELGIIASGDPILCKECGACFNKHSILVKRRDDDDDDDDEGKK